MVAGLGDGVGNIFGVGIGVGVSVGVGLSAGVSVGDGGGVGFGVIVVMGLGAGVGLGDADGSGVGAGVGVGTDVGRVHAPTSNVTSSNPIMGALRIMKTTCYSHPMVDITLKTILKAKQLRIVSLQKFYNILGVI